MIHSHMDIVIVNHTCNHIVIFNFLVHLSMFLPNEISLVGFEADSGYDIAEFMNKLSRFLTLFMPHSPVHFD